MTVPPLPSAFACRMRSQLGDCAPAYFDAMEQPPLRGLRLNLHRKPDAPLAPLLDGLGEPIPWSQGSYYLSLTSTAGATPLHEAGAFYLQEPSAMVPATVLDVRPGETVLDLCAAPGGKSTQLAAAMAGQGTLVCNEPVPSRAQVLSRNLERMGVPNALVVCADPAQLAERWPRLFDAILVDAPCSGEGMFRRHPETRLEWSEDSPARCALRQAKILQSACAMLKVGGRLCYSTCTFNREENEDTIAALVRQYPEMVPAEFAIPVGEHRALASQQGMLHLYPHEIMGEGHFVALLQKTATAAADAGAAAALLAPAQALNPPAKAAVEAFIAFWQDISPEPCGLSNVVEPCSLSKAAELFGLPNAALGETLLSAPPLPPVRGIRVLRAGLSLGQAKGRLWAPDHALAMAALPYALRSVPISETEACAYQRGEPIPSPEGVRGYCVVTFHGLALGFAKASDGWLKNHYPKGLRRP